MPDRKRIASSWQSQIHHHWQSIIDSKYRSHLLPVIPQPPQSANPDPLLPAKTALLLATREARWSERWKCACKSGETKHVRAFRASMSELWDSRYQVWKWVCWSSGSKIFLVVRVNIVKLSEKASQSGKCQHACQSELFKWACQS